MKNHSKAYFDIITAISKHVEPQRKFRYTYNINYLSSDFVLIFDDVMDVFVEVRYSNELNYIIKFNGNDYLVNNHIQILLFVIEIEKFLGEQQFKCEYQNTWNPPEHVRLCFGGLNKKEADLMQFYYDALKNEK
jgi:hypothetical protein